MSIIIKEKALKKESIETINLVNIIEKYYLPKDTSIAQANKTLLI